jgi:hypothetical protein
MNDEPPAPENSWRAAAEWVERSLAEGDPSLRFLPEMIDFVRAWKYDREFWAHPQDWGLVVSLSPALEDEPYLAIWASDDWPDYGIELRGPADQSIVYWLCEGPEELASVLPEAVLRLRQQGAECRA